MRIMAENAKKPQITTVISSNTFTGSRYAQFVGVTVTDIDVTLEFVFINPRDNTKGQVVSRVTLPRKVGESLAETIFTVMKMHDKKKEGNKNG